FNPETTKLMGRAYEKACEGVSDEVVRELIARRIIEAARRGERNLWKLIGYGRGGRDTLRGDWRTLTPGSAVLIPVTAFQRAYNDLSQAASERLRVDGGDFTRILQYRLCRFEVFLGLLLRAQRLALGFVPHGTFP